MDLFLKTVVDFLTDQLQKAGVDPLPEIDDRLIETPPDPAMGDYAFPCFSLAKTLRKAPPIIARELAGFMKDAVKGERLLRGVEAAGPYLNFRVSTPDMAAHVIRGTLEGSYFAEARDPNPKKVMVEYSQPNTHKAFHVGHMRNVALGDALVRILEYDGHEVVAANYIGDIGAHIAKCLWYYKNHQSEEPPAESRGEWLGELYSAATFLLEDSSDAEKASYQQEISEILRQLETDQGDASALWKETREWSLQSFEEIYQWLGARFDHVFYESEMEMGRRMVEEGLAAGVFVRSEGALGINLDSYNLGFFMVLKADGNTLYSTKDLALAQIKFRDFGIEESIYVVGAEQTLYFRQVFKTLELMGYEQAQDCHHLAYGLVMLPDGKMSSRAGNVILFSQLRQKLNEFIDNNYMGLHRGKWEDDEIEETTRRLAVAGIRYGMIKQDPSKTIVFNLEDWLVSEGDTGTYLCYAYTRIMSVLKKVPQQPDPRADFSLLSHDNERRLVRVIYDFNRAAGQAAATLRPNLLANALFTIAKEFSRTYRNCSVKNAETPELGSARLALFTATGIILKKGLELLGINPPDRM